ncbi:MAG: hypothetical protein KGQ46_02850 [Hyphomicrobiales bacterium]|nr:hypothetical protein [Hyphomicrobiales bacterium]MDE2115293.1 hypothetical protein [Hyphomicrobiales bacterium]
MRATSANRADFVLRMLADDLTGALDSAAQFASGDRFIRVALEAPDHALKGSIVIDCATREASEQEALRRFGLAAKWLDSADGRLSFFKIDSLLRGHPIAELATCLKREPERRCIIAPALPQQNRITRQGMQYAKFFDQWTQLTVNIANSLGELGFSCQLQRPGDEVPAGISLWDAESEADLAAIVAAGLNCGAPVLWCGCAGLASALAMALKSALATRPDLLSVGTDIPLPLIGLFGSDHPVMRDQLVQDAAYCVKSEAFKPCETAWVYFELPAQTSRQEAAAKIDQMISDLVGRIERPGTMVVSGGETLRALARILQATAIDVLGQIQPGIPFARLVGGPWDGVNLIAKSGAFGPPDFLVRLRQKATS